MVAMHVVRALCIVHGESRMVKISVDIVAIWVIIEIIDMVDGPWRRENCGVFRDEKSLIPIVTAHSSGDTGGDSGTAESVLHKLMHKNGENSHWTNSQALFD